MIKQLFLKCAVCGCEVDLPNDRSIKPFGLLAMPMHRKFKGRQLEPVESSKDPDYCPGSEGLTTICRVSEPFFKERAAVRIDRISEGDTLTSTDIIGHTGHIDEIDPLCNGDFNYFVQCDTCHGSHYMHESELSKL